MNPRELTLAGLSTAGTESFTPVQIQKLFFLIDRKVGDRIGGTGFTFSPYDYGPFDSTVYSTLEALNREGLVEIFPDPRLRTRRYRLTQDGQRLGAELRSKMEPTAAGYIERASEFVRSLSFAALVASIYKAFPEMRANSVFKD